ncbi:alpha/beta hydrolase [Arthrobacter agilis]|uniref:alpha/beta hydrolase n=1 Tax=Arthrobacter agilis TaxID=37921 RepID=UPI00277D73F3|nr:alpha/beta hydrolase [Arthrobacter agilis]MDQ0737117.1 pimeloyl-ACP methyl ester carboxylesterase [Arthrobacter agilis]
MTPGTLSPGPAPRRRPLSVLAAAAAVVLGLSGCTLFSPGDADAPATGVETADPAAIGEVPGDLRGFYTQEVHWEDCEGSFSCATIEVPLDYSDPGRSSIDIAAIRSSATGEAQGTILVNPGGPGGSGVNIVKDSLDYVTSERLREDYDILGFDPRGVNRSSAVKCLTDAEQDEARQETFPADASEDQMLALMVADAQEYADACADRTGELLGFVDTASAARDMDILRALVSDQKLNYLGFSYGTQLGATYADLFPGRVGRLVLDGAIDPSLSNENITLGQAGGFERALRAYVTACQQGADCPYTGSADDGVRQIQDLFAAVEREPLTAKDGRLVPISTFVQGFILPLYDNGNWPTLTQAVTEALGGDPTSMLYLADLAAERQPDGTYASNATAAFQAVNCLDYPMTSDPTQMRADEQELIAASPTFGRFLAYGGITCAPWKYPPVLGPAPLRAAGADPIVVIGTTGDPATPYAWSTALAEQLESGVHVTWQGEGHTAYGRSNDCILDLVDSYFIDGTVPADGTRC